MTVRENSPRQMVKQVGAEKNQGQHVDADYRYQLNTYFQDKGTKAYAGSRRVVPDQPHHPVSWGRYFKVCTLK